MYVKTGNLLILQLVRNTYMQIIRVQSVVCIHKLVGLFPFHVKASFGVVSSYVHIKYMYGNIFSLLKSGTMASLGPDWFLEEEGQPKNK